MILIDPKEILFEHKAKPGCCQISLGPDGNVALRKDAELRPRMYKACDAYTAYLYLTRLTRRGAPIKNLGWRVCYGHRLDPTRLPANTREVSLRENQD